MALTWAVVPILLLSADIGVKAAVDLPRLTPIEYLQTQAGVILHYLRSVRSRSLW